DTLEGRYLYQGVDAPEALDRGLRERIALRGIGDVCGADRHALARRIGLLRCGLQRGPGTRRRHHVRAVAHAHPEQLRAEAGADAGDDDRLAFEDHREAPPDTRSTVPVSEETRCHCGAPVRLGHPRSRTTIPARAAARYARRGEHATQTMGLDISR